MYGSQTFDPALILKMEIIAYLYHLSEREVEIFINENIPAKFFVGLALDQKAPDHSTLTVFHERLLTQGKLEVFKEMLDEMIQIARDNGVQFGTIKTINNVDNVRNS
jgi:IS5 family transposase